MSLKNRDKHNRWRSKTVAFRVSPEEDTQIETFVKLSGLTKQDYITRRLTCKDVVVQGNPRVYKALRDQLAAVLDELRRGDIAVAPEARCAADADGFGHGDQLALRSSDLAMTICWIWLVPS